LAAARHIEKAAYFFLQGHIIPALPYFSSFS